MTPVAYVVGSLTGGTCSGTFIDIAYALRHLLGQDTAIIGCFLVPNPVGLNDVHRSNTYAALVELNDFSIDRLERGLRCGRGEAVAGVAAGGGAVGVAGGEAVVDVVVLPRGRVGDAEVPGPGAGETAAGQAQAIRGRVGDGGRLPEPLSPAGGGPHTCRQGLPGTTAVARELDGHLGAGGVPAGTRRLPGDARLPAHDPGAGGEEREGARRGGLGGLRRVAVGAEVDPAAVGSRLGPESLGRGSRVQTGAVQPIRGPGRRRSLPAPPGGFEVEVPCRRVGKLRVKREAVGLLAAGLQGGEVDRRAIAQVAVVVGARG